MKCLTKKNNICRAIAIVGLFFCSSKPASAQLFDFGDAPDTYNTTLPTGARHQIINGIQLGPTAPDAELNGQPSADATGDGADEDGIILLPLTAGSTGYSIPPENITATNTGTATLSAWVDFNKNGTFEASEYASVEINNGTVVGSGLIWQDILVGSAGNTFARFRLTTDSSINASTPGGLAIDGEVEDYQLTIVSNTFNQTTDDTPSATSCTVQGGTLSAENIFTPYDRGTFGFEDGSPVQSPATNPYTGITGGTYAQYLPRVNNNDLSRPSFGEYSFVANITRARNRFQIEPVGDPVYGVTGRFFATDPDINSIPAIGVDLNGLIPNQFYEVEFWATNSEANGTPNQLDVLINNQSVFSTGPLIGASALPWKKYRFTFSNGPDTSIRLDIKSTEAGRGGLDFYLDNIELRLCNFKIDYGDAPISYGDAIHTTIPVSPVLFLGTIDPDDENLTQLGGDGGIGADGDDSDGNDDEDAFNILPSVPLTGTYDLNNIPVTNNSDRPATLQAWIDFNRNGVFEAGEYQEAIVNINQTIANLSWPVPAGTTSGQSFARFRLTSNPLSDDPTTSNIDERSQNAVIGGEVEDYPIAIGTTAPPELLLVKRITAINGQNNLTNNAQDLTKFNNDPADSNDDNPNWPLP